MTHQKSLKYINKIKQIAMDFFTGKGAPKPAAENEDFDVPVKTKGKKSDVYSYKQGKHKLKRKKPAKRTKLKK